MVFERLDLDRFKGKSVLILGLGLGSIIQILEEKRPGLHYTAVELDEEVIYYAEKYVLNKMRLAVNTVGMSADIFCNTTSEKYDLICMDVFIDDWIPPEYLTLTFCESLKGLLSPDGLLIFNTPAFNKKSAKKSKAFYQGHFLKAFENGTLLDVHKNYMLLSHKLLLR